MRMVVLHIITAEIILGLRASLPEFIVVQHSNPAPFTQIASLLMMLTVEDFRRVILMTLTPHLPATILTLTTPHITTITAEDSFANIVSKSILVARPILEILPIFMMSQVLLVLFKPTTELLEPSTLIEMSRAM